MTHQLLGWCSSSQDPTYSFAWSRETPPILPLSFCSQAHVHALHHFWYRKLACTLTTNRCVLGCQAHASLACSTEEWEMNKSWVWAWKQRYRARSLFIWLVIAWVWCICFFKFLLVRASLLYSPRREHTWTCPQLSGGCCDTVKIEQTPCCTSKRTVNNTLLTTNNS